MKRTIKKYYSTKEYYSDNPQYRYNDFLFSPKARNLKEGEVDIAYITGIKRFMIVSEEDARLKIAKKFEALGNQMEIIDNIIELGDEQS